MQWANLLSPHTRVSPRLFPDRRETSVHSLRFEEKTCRVRWPGFFEHLGRTPVASSSTTTGEPNANPTDAESSGSDLTSSAPVSGRAKKPGHFSQIPFLLLHLPLFSWHFSPRNSARKLQPVSRGRSPSSLPIRIGEVVQDRSRRSADQAWCDSAQGTRNSTRQFRELQVTSRLICSLRKSIQRDQETKPLTRRRNPDVGYRSPQSSIRSRESAPLRP